MRRVLQVAACAMVMLVSGAAERAEAATPIINSLSPNNKDAGSGTFIMTVTGTNFTSGSVVKWNGTSVSTGYVSSTQLASTIGSSLVTTAGTALVTVYTSGRKGGTSNSLNFTINTATITAPPPPPPPPPAPEPLSITTTSLPGGTANGSFSCNVAATGGTPAYGWALVNGGGSLPPGLTLSATGAISGTPTQAGTFSFTTQAADSSSQIAQKVLSIVVAADPNATPPPPSESGVLFQNGFEPTDTPWNMGMVTEAGCLSASMTEVTSATGVARTGTNAGHVHYVIGGTECNANQDQNRYFSHKFDSTTGYPNGIEHFFMRGYFKVHVNSGGTDNGVQRKLFYVKDVATGTFNLNVVLTSDSRKFRVVNGVIGGLGSNPCGATGVSYSVDYCNGPQCMNPPLWNPDSWYPVEMEVKMNTPGVADGVLGFWVNGVKYLNVTNANLRGTCTQGWRRFEAGVQSNRFNSNPIDEERYWDDLVISTQYVGP